MFVPGRASRHRSRQDAVVMIVGERERESSRLTPGGEEEEEEEGTG